MVANAESGEGGGEDEDNLIPKLITPLGFSWDGVALVEISCCGPHDASSKFIILKSYPHARLSGEGRKENDEIRAEMFLVPVDEGVLGQAYSFVTS